MDKICENIEIALAEYAGKFRCYPVPNILNITYGRGVGYKIEEEHLMKKHKKLVQQKSENKCVKMANFKQKIILVY